MKNSELTLRILACGTAMLVITVVAPIVLGKTTPQEMFNTVFGANQTDKTTIVEESPTKDISTTNKVEVIIKSDVEESTEKPKSTIKKKRRKTKQDEDLEWLLRGERHLIAHQTRQGYHNHRLESQYILS